MSRYGFSALLVLLGFFNWASRSAEIDELEKEFIPPKWARFGDVRGSFGYKDNLALSRSQREASAFFHSDLEFFAARLPDHGFDLQAFFEAEDFRYFSGQQVDHEDSVISQVELKGTLPKGWFIGATLDYVYQDLVTDVSTTDTNTVLQVQGHAFGVRPFVKKELGQKFWVELRLSGARQFYREPLDDYWEPGPRLLFGWNLPKKSRLTLSYEFLDRIYDTRETFDLAGSSISGTHLTFQQHLVDLRFEKSWDEARHWRTTSRLGYGRIIDNGPGFFDYSVHRMNQTIGYYGKDWLMKGTGRLSYYQYDNQTLSTTDLALRRKTMLTLGGRGEKQLTKSLRFFGEFENERSISNQAFDEYQVNTVSAGLEWEF
jgi:hypothetical protein